MTLTGNPAKSQCLKATAQRVLGALDLSVLQDLQWRAVGAWDTASQHSTEFGAAHTGLLKIRLKETYTAFIQIPLAKASCVAGKYSHTMCVHRERNPEIVSTSTNSTMGREMLRTSENSSPGSLGCAINMGHSQNPPTTSKSPLPAWEHVAPTRGSLLQSPRPPQKIPQGPGLCYLLSPSRLPNRWPYQFPLAALCSIMNRMQADECSHCTENVSSFIKQTFPSSLYWTRV